MIDSEIASIIGAIGGLTGVASVIVSARATSKKMSIEQGDRRYTELKALLETAKQDAREAKAQVDEIAAKWEASERRESELKVELARERAKHAALLKRVGALERESRALEKEVALCRQHGKLPDRRKARKKSP